MKKIITTTFIGIMMSLTFNVSAQEACDSTCYSAAPLRGGYMVIKPSGSQIVHNYNDYSVRYEYQYLSCPAGYQGRGGGAGSITERRAIITFNKGNTEIGEWIALSDNCEPIPVTPPVTTPPPVQKRTINLCTIVCYQTEVSFNNGIIGLPDFWGCYREQNFIFNNSYTVNAFEFKRYVGSTLYETDPWGFGTVSRLMTTSEFNSLTTWHLNCARPN